MTPAESTVRRLAAALYPGREVEVEDLDLVGSLQRYAVEHGIALSVTERAEGGP